MDKICKNNTYYVKEIPAKQARDIVKKYHYSKKIVPNSNLHLGVFMDGDKLVGALQFGPPMNPKSTPNNVAAGSNSTEMLELNRMVMDDEQPRNSESQAISLCINWIKKFRKDIHYLLSFSDGKEGNVGYIYQATNWTYVGYRLSDSFYRLDNQIMHAVQVWHLYKEKHPDRDKKTTHEILFDNFSNVSKVVAKQHTYVFPLSKKYKFTNTSYPKKDTELRILKETFLKKEGVVLSSNIVCDYTKIYQHRIIGNYVYLEYKNNYPAPEETIKSPAGIVFGKYPYNCETVSTLNECGFAIKLPQIT